MTRHEIQFNIFGAISLMNLKLRYNVFTTAVALLLVFFSSCEKKVDLTQKTNDIITARTVGLAYLEENLLDEAEKKFITLIQLAPEEAMAYALESDHPFGVEDYENVIRLWMDKEGPYQ